MISAFAKASQVFDNKNYYNIALRAADFIMTTLKDKSENLLHRYRQNESAINGMIDDYSFFIAALLDIYETEFDYKYLEEAVRLTNHSFKKFWDEKEKGFFFTSNDGEKLLLRQKEFYDGAIPSGNSVFILNLLRLSRITGNADYEEKANELSDSFSQLIDSSPASFAYTLTGLDFGFGPSLEIVISSDKDENLIEMLDTIHNQFIPNKVLIKYKEDAESLIPFLKNYQKVENKTLVYVCMNYACEQPVDTKEKLERVLKLS
jgi:uncharacterized protein YyaL (SSP411 family)